MCVSLCVGCHFLSLRGTRLITVGEAERTHALHGEILYPTTSSAAPDTSARASIGASQVAPSYVLQWFRPIRWDPDPLQETQTRSEFVLVVDPIHRRFEDQFMGWSVDQYWFVQWRSDGDSVLKLCHFMWVFVMCISLFTVVGMRLHVTLIISCDFLLYFISLITCITSWDIYNCSLYLHRWYEFVSAFFHVLVVYRCELRPNFDTP